MHARTSGFVKTTLASAIALMLTAGSGCTTTGSNAPAVQTLSEKSQTRPAGEPGVGQQQFDTDDLAAAALVAAAKAYDQAAIDKMFGPSSTDFISGDKVEDQKSFDHFVASAADHLTLEKKDGNTSIIDVGKDNYPFPIPLTRLANGKWFFDTEAGKQEILDRRIGWNELKTEDVCRAYVEAQWEYSLVDHDGSGVPKYAQHLISKNGHDGLYWDAAPGEPQSPFGPLVAQANMEGYDPQVKTGTAPQPYYGYVYKILTRQGPDAPGGAYSYIINGNMIAGFALVARPIDYGKSGFYTFIISQNGKLYQKNLGPNTADIVRNMQEYNPDSSWALESAPSASASN